MDKRCFMIDDEIPENKTQQRQAFALLGVAPQLNWDDEMFDRQKRNY